MHCDLDAEVSKVPHNHPYLVAMVAANAVRFYHIAECVLLCEATSFTQGLMNLIATYYTFDMAYPKPLIPILNVERVVMNVSASAQVPNSVTKLHPLKHIQYITFTAFHCNLSTYIICIIMIKSR